MSKLIQKIKKLTNKRFWTSEQWKTGNDIERLVWFISTLSPHNLWRGQEAIEKAISQSKEELMEEIRKKFYKSLYGKQWVEIGMEENFEAGKISITNFEKFLEDLNKK